MKRISIIIPVCNRKEELLKCLESIFRQRQVTYEVIVIDDAGSDGVKETLKKLYPEVKVLHQETRRGPAFSRNAGIKVSIGDCLLFLDSDTELPDPQVLLRMLEGMEGDDHIGSLGGEIYIDADKTKAIGRNIGFFGRSYQVAAKKYEPPKECAYLATCNCFVSKKTALRIGGFDPYYFFGAEDEDFGFRIKKADLVNLLAYHFGVYHHRIPKARLSCETFYYHLTRRRFIIKNVGAWRFAVLFFLELPWFVSFYPLLPFKIAYKAVRGIEIKKESFSAPFLVLRADVWNIKNLRKTISSRNKNFLATEEIERFLNWCKGVNCPALG